MRLMIVLLFSIVIAVCARQYYMDSVHAEKIYTVQALSQQKIDDGEAAYVYAQCFMCHGREGDGKGRFEFLSKNLQRKMPDFTSPKGRWLTSREQMRNKIRVADDFFESQSHMPIYDGLSERQVDKAITFILSFLMTSELMYEGKPAHGELCMGGKGMVVDFGVPIHQLSIRQFDSRQVVIPVAESLEIHTVNKTTVRIKSPWMISPVSDYVLLEIQRVEDVDTEKAFAFVPIIVQRCW